MSEKDLKKREVVTIDIAKYSQKEKGKVSKSEDVSQWHSSKRNIGPLEENWYQNANLDKIMWCYKNVTIHCNYLGFRTVIENLVRKQQKMIFTRSMRQMVVQMDEWDGLSLEEIRRMEKASKTKLDELIKTKELSEE